VERVQPGDKPLEQPLALKETRREAASTLTEEFPRVLEITALIPRCLEVAEPGTAARRANGAYVGVVVGCKALQLALEYLGMHVYRAVWLVLANDIEGERGWIENARDEGPFLSERRDACVSGRVCSQHLVLK